MADGDADADADAGEKVGGGGGKEGEVGLILVFKPPSFH